MIGGIPNVGKSTTINTFKTLPKDLKELSQDTKKYAKTGKLLPQQEIMILLK